MSKLPWENYTEDATSLESKIQLESSLEHKDFYGYVCTLKVAVGTHSSQNEEPKTYIKLQSANGFKVTPVINWECTCQGQLERNVLLKALKYIVASLEAKTPLTRVAVTPIEFPNAVPITEEHTEYQVSPMATPTSVPEVPKKRSHKKKVLPPVPQQEQIMTQPIPDISTEDLTGLSESLRNFVSESGVSNIDTTESITLTDTDLETDTTLFSVTPAEAGADMMSESQLNELINNLPNLVEVDTVKLRNLFTAQGISMSKFASKAGVHFTTFSRLVHGKSSSCRVPMLLKLAKSLNGPITELLKD